MNFSKLFVYLSFCHFIAICIFVLGFLPFRKRSAYFSHFNSSELVVDVVHQGFRWDRSLNYNHFKSKRIVLMVIDALRADFVINSTQNYMPFLSSLHEEKKSCSYSSKAHTPTVTLPRIKALVTGGIPDFSDVIFNLGSSQLHEEDNIVYQLINSGHNIVFYGDETWLRLFPEKFLRKEGTTSFFVNDYTEVDQNVTRHLDFELDQTDWSVMILHYLGLDHIGHTSGPKSSLVPTKLKEMDNIIKIIYERFHGNDTMIVICGDHGMSDSGSHGGSSSSETDISLTFIVDGCHPDADSTLQIDLAPTLSVLMGVPIPSNSLGSLLKGILPLFSPSERLNAVFANAYNIAEQFETLKQGNAEENPFFQKYQKALKMFRDLITGARKSSLEEITNIFLEATDGMREHLIENLATFDVYLMIIGIVLAFQVFIIGTMAYGADHLRILNEDSDFFRAFILSAIFTILHTLTCFSIDSCSSLCLNGQNTLFFTLGLSGLIISMLSINCSLILKFSHKAIRMQDMGANIPEWFLLIGTIIHSLSLGASSFVEEEHQTYYFLVSTLILLLIRNHQKHQSNVIGLVTSLVIVRIARNWNQTGDKWINEPDMEDWLNLPAHRSYLTFLSLIAIIGIYCWIVSTQILTTVQKVATGFGLTGIVLHRAAIGTLSFNYPASKGIVEAGINYSSILVIIFSSKDRTASCITSWILLTSVLKRPHHLFLTWLQLLQYSLLQPSLTSQLRPFYFGLATYWIGMSWYFQQGNGNNLARIDLSAGYVGLREFNPLIVGFFLICSTYSGPVLALLLSSKSCDSLSQLQGFQWPRILIVTLFLIIVTSLRYHLFVWTVFSPKLLYEAVWSGFLACLLLLILCRNKAFGKYSNFNLFYLIFLICMSYSPHFAQSYTIYTYTYSSHHASKEHSVFP